MKREKDIFDLIKDNEHKLSERPSDRTWRRLEQRLDHKSQRRQLISFRTMSWAAVIIALAVMAVMISLVVPNASERALAVNSKEPAPLFLEDLTIYSDAVNEIAEMEAFRKKHEMKLSNAIEEGTGNKRLVLQKLSNEEILSTESEISGDSAKTKNRGI